MSLGGNAQRLKIRIHVRHRLAARLAAARRGDAALDRRRGRHVVGGRGAAGRAIGIRRCARASFVALHFCHAGICDRRRGDGASSRPDWNSRTDQCRRGGDCARLSRRRRCKQPCDVRARACGHRIRQFGDARSADGRYLAVVCPPARPCGDAVLVGKLFRRRNMAADRAAGDCTLWLATDASEHRLVRRRGDAPDRVGQLAAACACRQPEPERERIPGHLPRNARPFARHAAGLACRRLGVLLRRDVDAAGSHRRLSEAPSCMASPAAPTCCR